MTDSEIETDRQPWLGGLWALVPHLMLLVWMLWSAATAEERPELAGMLVLLEIWLVPAGLIAAALMWRSDRFRGRTPWVAGATVLGAAIVWIAAVSL